MRQTTPSLVADGERRPHLVDQGRQREGGAARRRQAARREAERLGAERDGPVDRGHQGERQLLHLRVARRRQAIRQHGRGRQHVAEIVVDLGDAGAEGGEARPLAQRRTHAPLHDLKLALRDADLVAPAADPDRRGGILRRAAERDQAVGHAAERQHHDPVQGEIDQAGDDEGEDDGEHQDAPRIVDHRREERGLRQQDVDHRVGRVAGRGPHHPDGPLAAVAERVGSLPDQAERGRLPQVEARVDRDRHVIAEHQPARAGPLERNRADAGAGQQGGAELLGHHPVRRRLDGQRRDPRGVDPLFEEDQAVAGDRGDVDQHLAQEDEQHRERQQPRREAAGGPRQDRKG